MWPWRVKMPTQNLLRLLLLLMLMLRIMLATVCYRFGPKAKLLFRPWAQGLAQIWSWIQARFWSWSLFSILPLMFCRGNEVESWSRFWSHVCSISWILSLVERLMFANVEILKLVRDQYSGDGTIWHRRQFDTIINLIFLQLFGPKIWLEIYWLPLYIFLTENYPV